MVHNAVVTLTDAQIKSLTNTLVEVIADPGAGKIAIPVFTCVFTSGFGANPYTGVDADGYLTLVVAGPSDIQDIIINDSFLTVTNFTALMELASGMTVVSAPLSQLFLQGWGITGSPIQHTLYTNSAISLRINNNGNTADLGGGDAGNTMSVSVLYVILDTTTGEFS